jgi:hypothetical protein
MPVRELLMRIDSHEIGEWMAYERAFGPINDDWQHEALNAIYEQLRIMNNLFGVVNWGEDNPAHGIPPLPKPHVVLRKNPEDDALGIEDDDDPDEYSDE